MDVITSIQNPRVKQAHALHSRTRTRHKEGKVVLEGVRLVRDAWQSGATPDAVFYTPGTADDLISALAGAGVEALPADAKVIQHITQTTSPQGVAGIFHTPSPVYPTSAARVLVLDGISDPGNLGTLLRTAAGAGVDVVVLAPGCVDAYNPKVLRSGMGAHFRLPVLPMTWEQMRDAVRVDAVYLADATAAERYDAVRWADGAWALVIGSEAHGASDEARAFATHALAIPMAHATESLNAAAAAAVILFEAARQRGFRCCFASDQAE